MNARLIPQRLPHYNSATTQRLLSRPRRGGMAECICPSSPLTTAPLVTCRAVGDPHYQIADGTRFSYYGRGLYEHARFRIEKCGCEVVMQTLNAKLIRGKVCARRGWMPEGRGAHGRCLCSATQHCGCAACEAWLTRHAFLSVSPCTTVPCQLGHRRLCRTHRLHHICHHF